jgi:hypothetical protein
MSRVEKFMQWMRDMGNVYYQNKDLMSDACKKIIE